MTAIFRAKTRSQGGERTGVTVQLDEIRARWRGVDAVAFVDLECGTLLGISSDAGKPQEAMDEQCRLARLILSPAGDAGGRAILATRREITTYQALAETPGYALCLSLSLIHI